MTSTLDLKSLTSKSASTVAPKKQKANLLYNDPSSDSSCTTISKQSKKTNFPYKTLSPPSSPGSLAEVITKIKNFNKESPEKTPYSPSSLSTKSSISATSFILPTTSTVKKSISQQTNLYLPSSPLSQTIQHNSIQSQKNIHENNLKPSLSKNSPTSPSTLSSKSQSSDSLNSLELLPKTSVFELEKSLATNDSISEQISTKSISTIKPNKQIDSKNIADAINIDSEMFVTKENTASSLLVNGEIIYFQMKNESLSQATLRIFPKTTKYESKSTLRELVESFASYWEFCIATDGMKYTCNRAGETNNKRLKQDTAQRVHDRTFKCNCPWRIHFRYEIKHQKEGPVIISNVFPNHVSPCIPSLNQFQEARKVSGQLTKYVDMVLKDLVNFLWVNKYVEPETIRAMLYRCYPKAQYITSTGINNARLRAQMIVDDAILKGVDPTDLSSFNKLSNLTKLKLDFNDAGIYDQALQASDNIFRGILNHCHGNNKVLNFLYQLSMHDKGFTYKIFFNSNNQISGFMWMTSSMRSNFERFGSFLCIDAMKRAFNIYLWPYIAPTVVTEFNNVMVVCECLVAGETKEAYIAILKGLSEMAPGRTKDEVKAIYADEFVTLDTLRKAGYLNTRLFFDHVHYQKKFSKKYRPLYEEVRLQITFNYIF